jgi:hypothetical protein
MTWLFCVTDAEELRKATRQRWLAAAFGAFVLFVVRPFVGRWASRRSARTLVGEVGRYGAAGVLALLACEVYLRKRPLAKQPPPVTPDHPEAVEDPRYGWGHVPSHTTTLRYGEKVILAHTDADGDRVRNAGDAPDPSLPTILFLGESITSGIGLEYDETYPAMIGERLGVQTVNMGVHGYGTDNEYLRLQYALPRYAKPIAVVALVIAEQLERNVDDAKQVRFVLANGALRPEGAAPELWRTSPIKDLFGRVTRYHSDDAIALTRALLRGIRDQARAKGATPLFVLTHWGKPCLPDETGEPSIERTLFEGEDLPHVTVDLRGTWVPSIQHPGPEGHKRIADSVIRALDGKIAAN